MFFSANDVMHHSLYDDVNFSSVDGHVINQETACLLDPEKSSEFYPKWSSKSSGLFPK